MSKSITTLIPDVYSLLEKGEAKIDSGKLSTMISKRLAASGSGDALRMSTLGEKCKRKLWYRHNSKESADPLPGHTLLTFLIGDILEEVVLSLAEQAGHKVEGQQDELELHGVTGHRDAIIDGVTVDVKSANSRSIEKFRQHALERDDPFGYMDQLSAYAEASKDDPRVRVKKEASFLVVDKELGHLILDTYKTQERDWASEISRLRGVLAERLPPDRPYEAEADGSSGNEKLPLPCRYCQYKSTCWSDANEGRGLRKFIYSNGPRWLTKVIRDPNVPEESKGSQNRQGLVKEI